MMLRTVYCCNPNPVFATPKKHKPRPPFTQRCDQLIQKGLVALWDGFLALVALNPLTLEVLSPRQRRFNKYRAQAMQAMARALNHHINITTGIVHCTIEKLADYCGLSTKSKAGNRSITRASRVIQLFEEYGLLKCERTWDPILHIWYPKFMQVTPLFFQMIGSSEQEWEAAKRQQQGYQRQGLLKHAQEEITPCEAAARLKARLKELYLKNRKERHEKKRALKLLKKSREEQRHEICKKLTREMSLEEMCRLGLEGVQKLVNEKLSELRKFIGYSPPT